MSAVKNQQPILKVLPDAETVGRECLQQFIAIAERKIKKRGVFRFAISGGQTPKGFFELLGSDSQAKELDWGEMHIFWVDERYVPYDSQMSNYKLAADTFLVKVPLPEQNIHPIPTEGDDIETSAREYEGTIRSCFGLKPGQLPVFDFVLLGMGTDGHIGSIFPNFYNSFNTNRIACVVYLPVPQVSRITLTHKVLMAASQLIVLVTGEQKADMLKTVLTSQPDAVHYPIHTLWPALSKILWLVDASAAKLL